VAGAGAPVVRPACPAAGLAASLLRPLPPVSPHVSTCEPEGGGGARGAAALEESTKLSCFVVVVGVGITRWGLKRMDGAG
jgi:hypothetical protein